MDTDWAAQSKKTAQEDLVLFINSCMSCTGQREFYDDASGQRVSINFLHDYILTNYRRLYARTLAAGINHFNQSEIILKLLATGKDVPSSDKLEEGSLIAAALRAMPPQRARAVLKHLRKRRINNRRSRAITRDFVASRRDISFDAVKYRSKLKAVVSHAHLKLPGETGCFLFKHWERRTYKTALLETFRQARYNAEAIYKLPFTVAEGLARKHNINRSIFLSRIQERMTVHEKLRMQKCGETEEVKINVTLERLPLTRLATYILSLPLSRRAEQSAVLNQAMSKAAANVLRKSPLKLGRVAAVLDCSYSSAGSTEKKRRPLAVALASHYLLKAAASEYRDFWTQPVADAVCVIPRGQTDLAEPLLAALEWGAELIVIVSDGWENDPPTAASEIIRIQTTKLDVARKMSIIHCNPVFDSQNLSPAPQPAGADCGFARWRRLADDAVICPLCQRPNDSGRAGSLSVDPGSSIAVRTGRTIRR